VAVDASPPATAAPGAEAGQAPAVGRGGPLRRLPPEFALAPVAVLLILAVLARPRLIGLLARPAVANWATVFVAVTVQALPFLVLGVTVSAGVAAFVPPSMISGVFPDRPLYAVPVAALAGAALPGCECGSVPIARRLMARGVTPAAALTFLLSAPAINPVVLVATAVAFPGQPEMVVARFGASLLAAVSVGLAWTAFGRADLLAAVIRPATAPGEGGVRPIAVFAATARHDFLSAGGYLVIGAAAAASLQTAVPRSVVDVFAGSPVFSVLALAVLAVLLAICSEADAFVAAGLKQFSPTARLAFLIVGPMVDVKLIALQAGTFGRRFTLRFAPLTFVCALGSAVLVGWWVL
jgi:uncharacterized membrane protein YraQ (UPF0718 family)